jgi:hypothetical protein
VANDDTDEPITQDEIEEETRRQNLIVETTNLSALCGAIGAILIIIGVVGIIGGIVIAMRQTTVLEFGGGSHLEHRSIPFGVAVSIGSFVQIGLVVIFTKTAGIIADYVRYQIE